MIHQYDIWFLSRTENTDGSGVHDNIDLLSEFLCFFFFKLQIINVFFPVNHVCDGWGCFPMFRGLVCGWPARSVCCCSLSVNTNRILQIILHNRLIHFPLLFVNEFLCYWHISENFPTETARLFIRRRALVAADEWRHSAATVSSGVTRFYLFCFVFTPIKSEVSQLQQKGLSTFEYIITSSCLWLSSLFVHHMSIILYMLDSF